MERFRASRSRNPLCERDTGGMSIDTAVYSPHWDTAATPGAPVMLLLHGFGSHENDLPGLAAWLPQELAWASPRAPIAMEFGGATWFPFTPGQSPEPDHIVTATTQLWEWIDAHVDESSPIVPIGFSQGGLMAVELLRTRPERIAATVVLAGLIAPTERAADAHISQSRPPVFWGRGADDTVIWPAAISRAEAFLSTHTDLSAHVYSGLAHSVDERMMTDMKTFLTTHLDLRSSSSPA